MCLSELRGLGAVHDELVKRGGRLLTISVDQPEDSRRVVENLKLPFPVLCDTDRTVTKAYGLMHPGAGPGGSDVPIPAHILIERGGKIVWRHVSGRVSDRPDPTYVVDRIRAL